MRVLFHPGSALRVNLKILFRPSSAELPNFVLSRPGSAELKHGTPKFRGTRNNYADPCLLDSFSLQEDNDSYSF